MTYLTGCILLEVAVGDVNGDNQKDIVVNNLASDTVSVYLGFDNGSFTSQITFPTGCVPYDIVPSDLNGDGPEDLIIPNNGNATVAILLNTCQ